MATILCTGVPIKIINISRTDLGVQVVIELQNKIGREPTNSTITKDDFHWPRIQAAGNRLKEMVGDLERYELVRIDTIGLGSTVEQQFSYENRTLCDK